VFPFLKWEWPFHVPLLYSMDWIVLSTLFLLDQLVLGLLRNLSVFVCDSESHSMRSYVTGKMILEECLSFKERESSTTFSFKSTASDMDVLARSIISPQVGEKGNQLTRTDSLPDKKLNLSLLESGNQRHQAAVTLQKVYKSFRTRRQLADCAVVVEQRWLVLV
jgi:hypothetical protein